MPEIAPSLLSLLEKMPNNNTGNNVEAAKPKAKATTWATNASG